MGNDAVRRGAEQKPNVFGTPDDGPPYDYIWHWTEKARPALGDRKGERCRVLIWGGMNSALVQFASDGKKVNTSRSALRKAPAEHVRDLFGGHPNAQKPIDKPDSPAPVGGVRLFGIPKGLEVFFQGFGESVFGADEGEEVRPLE